MVIYISVTHHKFIRKCNTLSIIYKRYALRGVVVSTHACIWYTYYSCICQARVHANETCELCGINACAHAKQNTRVQFVQTKDAHTLLCKS